MKTNIIPFLITVLCVLTLPGFAQQSSGTPRVFIRDANELRQLRSQIQTGKDMSDAAKCATSRAKKDADKVLNIEIQPVTAKPLTPPSGDKHDYMSLAPYFWPDPKKKDGLPYIRRDGERNPEIKTLPDHDALADLIKAVDKLAVGYYLTGDERYAAKATSLLSTWFVTPATRMNPNMEFAQAVRGESTGRNFGIIETMGLVNVVDSVGLLTSSKAWSKPMQDGMEKWFTSYLDWLQNSKLGKLESGSKNNHGTHYDEQVADYALFVGKIDIAKQVIEAAKEKRLAFQIEPDGSQPLELARTQSWDYSTMNLNGYVHLARLGEAVNIDLWNFQTKDGRSIKKAMGYLAQFTSGGKKWDHETLSPLDPEKLNRNVRIAGTKYTDKPFQELVQAASKGDGSSCPVLFSY